MYSALDKDHGVIVCEFTPDEALLVRTAITRANAKSDVEHVCLETLGAMLAGAANGESSRVDPKWGTRKFWEKAIDEPPKRNGAPGKVGRKTKEAYIF